MESQPQNPEFRITPEHFAVSLSFRPFTSAKAMKHFVTLTLAFSYGLALFPLYCQTILPVSRMNTSSELRLFGDGGTYK